MMKLKNFKINSSFSKFTNKQLNKPTKQLIYGLNRRISTNISNHLNSKKTLSSPINPIRAKSNFTTITQETYIPDPNLPPRTTLVITTKDYPGSLEEVLAVFREQKVNLTRIESKYSQKNGEVSFFVDIELAPNHNTTKKLLDLLKKNQSILYCNLVGSKEVPWFPVTMEEVDSLALLVLEGGSDLEADHPGFHDQLYRKRRAEIAEAASTFKYGDKPERIVYTKEEIECWNTIWNKLYPLLNQHACIPYLNAFNALQKYCGYKEGNIPQLSDVSDFIYDRTRFKLRPTAGLISSRHFLNGLAFNTFFCTQYLRHHSVPFYTPEPDVVHELVGHAPLFADPEFARFSQEIGLASIGATDEQIIQLARCYWFSVEFGLCRKSPTSNEKKIYGAGVLSSYGEIEWSMSDKPEIREWDPFEAALQDYPITKYQPMYYLAVSFEDAKNKMSEFAKSFDKPFSCRWDEVQEKLIVDRNIKRQARTYEKGTYVGTEE